MMRPLHLTLLVILLSGVPLASQAAPNTPDLGRMVLTEKQAVLLPAAELVAGWNVERAAWSPSGQYILASRNHFTVRSLTPELPDFRQSLVLWDSREQKSSEVWKVTVAPNRAPQFEWLASGDVAYALVQYRPPQPIGQQPQQTPSEPRQWLLRIDARRTVMKPLFSVPEYASLHVSPREPLAIVFSDQDRLIRVLRADGTTLRQVPFPMGMSLVLPRWSNDGTRFLTTSVAVRDEKNPRDPAAKAADYALDLRTGQLVRQATREQPQDPEAPANVAGELRLRRTRSVVREGSIQRPISPLWLESTEKDTESRALIAPDAEWAQLSPRGDAALFISDGSAFVIPFISLPKEAYIQAREAALRTVAISNGKQLGLAAHIYAQEHDEQLPGADQPVAQLLREYAKADALYEGFVYTFPGGKLADVAEPSKTLLGYVMGPGGRAEIFVDGHVVWKKDE